MHNEDFDRELLVAVALICTAFAAGASAFEPAKEPISASAQATVRIEQLEPVRIIGTPLVLNTNPRER